MFALSNILLSPVYSALKCHNRRLCIADENFVVGSEEGGWGEWGGRRKNKRAGVGKYRQTLLGPALSVLIELIDSSYKRTDNKLPKSSKEQMGGRS